MRFSFFKTIIVITFFVGSLFSCSSDLDFGQVDDLNIQPVFTTNLAYLQFKASDFIVNGREQLFFSYTSNVDFFNTSVVEEDVNKAELYFRFKNTIERAFVYSVTFFDVNNAPIYTIRVNVPAYSGNEILIEKTETFTGDNLAILSNTTHIVSSVLMLPGEIITNTTLGRVEFSSSITAYFDIK